MHNRYVNVDLVSDAEHRRIRAKLLHPQYDTFFKYASDLDIADQADGNVEAPVGWYALIHMGNQNSYEGVIEAVKDRTDGAGWDSNSLPNVGFYVTQLNNDGIVWAYEFEVLADAQTYYNELNDAFTAWSQMEQNDEE